MNFRGKGMTIKNPAIFIAEKDFYVNDRLVPKGSKVKQFETLNAGWTSWEESNGNKHLTRE